MKILNKISVKKIIKNHWLTLVNHTSKKMEFDDALTFIILPLIISGILAWQRIMLNTTAASIIITSLSIFVGLLFNAIVVIFDIINRHTDKEERKELLRQILSNISFSIFISILTIVFCLFSFAENCIVRLACSALVYFLASNFLFTVLMILKRIYALFYEEIEDTP